MASHATHIRRIYSRPWRHGSGANPGKIPTCVQVSVRPETTITLETMLQPSTQLLAGRAPAGFSDNAFARFVVDVSETSTLSAAGLPECLSGTLAAVGLQTTTQGQMLIAPMAQSFTAPDPARAAGGKRILPDIHAHDRAGCHPFAIVGLHDEIEKPAPPTQDQFCLLGSTALQHLALVIPEDHRKQQAPSQGVERDGLLFECIGAMVEMDARAVKTQAWNRSVRGDASQGALGAISLADREDGIARHLRPQSRLLSQPPVTELVQGDPIQTALFLHQGHEAIAGVGVRAPQGTQPLGVLGRDVQSNAV